MRYKSYKSIITYDNEAKVFYGNVIGLRDIITFEGTTIAELEQAFKDSIDIYFA